jgi:hypothetical protein
MGRMLGTFADDDELDRPDLNKCPDCDCFFASDTCPLCKKICPEEMRAGNRKPVKHKKQRRNAGSGRVMFISWYHRWWFIILMLALFPLVGIILCITSPHQTWKKVLCIALYVLLPTIIGGTMVLGSIFIGEIFGQDFVDTSLTREEYVAACQEVTPEEYYRSPGSYEDAYIRMTLKVERREVSDSAIYYVCTDPDNCEIVILVRDYFIEDQQNFLSGDLVTLYCQYSPTTARIEVDGVEYIAPFLFAAYAEVN